MPELFKLENLYTSGDIVAFTLRLPSTGEEVATTDDTQVIEVTVRGIKYTISASGTQKGKVTPKHTLLPQEDINNRSVLNNSGVNQTEKLWDLYRDVLDRKQLGSMDMSNIILMALTIRASGAFEVATLPLVGNGDLVNGFVPPESKRKRDVLAHVRASVEGKVVLVQRTRQASFVADEFPNVKRVISIRNLKFSTGRDYIRCSYHNTWTEYPCATNIVQCMQHDLTVPTKEIWD